MLKILNWKVIKILVLYFILCLLLSFSFQKIATSNELLSFYSLEKIENYFGYLVLCSRLILVFTIVIVLIQDFMDLYGAKYIFIVIRKVSNLKYFCYIIIKEFIYLIYLSFAYLLSQIISSGIMDDLNLLLIKDHYINFLLYTYIIFLITVIVATIFSYEKIFYCFLIIALGYIVLFSTGKNQYLLSYLNFNNSWLIIQLTIIVILTTILYWVQQIWR